MRKFSFALLLFCCTTFCYANLPYFPISFPRDEGAHDQNVPYTYSTLMEWWYVNGSVTTEEGKHLGFDVAMFNPTMDVAGHLYAQPQLQIQIADLDSKKSMGTRHVYTINSGEFSRKTLNIIVDKDYFFRKTVVNGKVIYLLHANGQAGTTSIQLDLALKPSTPPFLINQNGLMPMPNNTNSYYYSIPHFNTSGKITLNGTSYVLKTGDSWMDHQWGDFNVQQNGWEWFSVRLDNGLIGNIFLNIDYNSKKVISGLASIILPNGKKYFIPYSDFKVTRDDYWFDARESISYPTTFTFTFPSLGLSLRNVAAYPEQEVHGYWEGYCNVTGVYQKQDVNGFSYAELVYINPASRQH